MGNCELLSEHASEHSDWRGTQMAIKLHFDPSGDLLNFLLSSLKCVLIKLLVVFYKKIHISRGFKVAHLVNFVPQSWENGRALLSL